MSHSSSGEFGEIYEQILLQLNCLLVTDLTHCRFLNYFSAITNTNFNARPWRPGIKVFLMEWYQSERNCIAAVHHCLWNIVSPSLLGVIQLFHLLLLHGIMCLQHHLLASFSSHTRYQHHMVRYLHQLELLSLLLLQSRICQDFIPAYCKHV